MKDTNVNTIRRGLRGNRLTKPKQHTIRYPHTDTHGCETKRKKETQGHTRHGITLITTLDVVVCDFQQHPYSGLGADVLPEPPSAAVPCEMRACTSGDKYTSSSGCQLNRGGMARPLGKRVAGSRSSSKNGCCIASMAVVRSTGEYWSSLDTCYGMGQYI